MRASTAGDRLVDDLPESLKRAVLTHDVVLVVSPVTDARLITHWLEQRGRAYHRVELSMAAPESRATFDRLRLMTRWHSLPQVFLEGRFIGGIPEFLAAVEQDKVGVMNDGHIRGWASLLGYAGLLPFFGLALLSVLAPESLAERGQQALLGYGAVILAFVGALHWARGLQTRQPAGATCLLIVSVLPALLGWLALLLPVNIGLVVLAMGFGLLYLYDRRAWRSWAWFLSLRSRLTAGAVASLLMVWVHMQAVA